MTAAQFNIVDMKITARYQGQRRLEWRVARSPGTYFVKISANPALVDLSAIDVLFRLPPDGSQRGDPDWFEVKRLTSPRARRMIGQAWAIAETQRMFSADAFARADAKRTMEAAIQRRATDLFGVLSHLIASHDAYARAHPFRIDEDNPTVELGPARHLLEDIEGEAAATYESVLKALNAAQEKEKGKR